ncbi:hypothetical protein IW261DRAFT_1437350 [Armillaria novae-zelandiae]|uniref:C2H2-type domain-containing protein n=1 Tax=Armillaria novae-zelandiae TaxID=153914 RepID=A0AA39PWD0_9AGAR|nr:hypothetical protein IW261DRAFT_1437350 [Armillaria novae-zelandiae]
MSLERTNDKGVFTAESYRQNTETIQAMRAHLDRAWATNEMAELERKVREGEDAKRKLSELQKLTTANHVGPVYPSSVSSIEPVQPTAYIEEVGYDHQVSPSWPVLRRDSQPNTSRQSYQNVYANYVPTPHVPSPVVAQNSANLAHRHPHKHRPTTSTPGPVASNTNSARPVHWQGGHDFRTSSLANAFGTPYPPVSHMQKSTGPPTAQPTLAAMPNLTQSSNVQQNVAQSENLSTGNAIRNEHGARSSQHVILKQQQQLAFDFNTAVHAVREWKKESVLQTCHRFKQCALPNTHVDIPELRLRLAKLKNSTVYLVIVDDQGMLMEVHEYLESQDLPQRLQARIATLAINAPTKTSQLHRDPPLPKEPTSESNQPSQSQTTPVFSASKHAAAPTHTSRIPAASRPYAATPDISSNGTLPNGLANTGEYSRSASPGPPSSNTLTPRANSPLPHPRDAAIASSPSVLEGPRTPSHANKPTLARDVLRALGFSGKREREGGSENEDERASKKRVIDDRSSVSTTNSTSSIQAPAAITGAPVPSTNRRHAYQPYNPYRAWIPPSAQAASPLNLSYMPPKAIPNTVSPGEKYLSTTADSRTKIPLSQMTTLLLPVGTTSTMSDSSAVKVMATPSSYSPSTQNRQLADKDTVAASDLEVSQSTGTSLIQNNDTTVPPSRLHSPIDDQEGDSGSSKLPLFFRSSSTPLGDTSEIDDFDRNDAKDIHIVGPAEPLSEKAFGKSKTPYILIPPPPTWVKEFKARLERRRRNEAILEETDDDESLCDDVVGFESPAQGEIGSVTLSQSINRTSMTNPDSQRHSRMPLLDEKEEAAMQKCSSRLREAPCKWRDCDSLLNCADKLYLHLQNHVEQNNAEKSFPCHWQRCGRVFLHKHEMIFHLQVHAFMPVHCAYENCEETFRTARQYLQHSLQIHQTHKLRPSADPVLLQGHAELPDVPSVVPSYMAVSRSVAQYPISPGRHQVIGLWTLQNIFGKVDLAPQRYNLAKPFRPGEASAAELRSGHEYDFLETKPPMSSFPSRSAKWESMKGVADLNSDEVTAMFKDKGIVLWGKGGDDDIADEVVQAGNEEEAVRVLLQV